MSKQWLERRLELNANAATTGEIAIRPRFYMSWRVHCRIRHVKRQSNRLKFINKLLIH